MTARPIGIVGGGIVGLAIARELTHRFPGRQVVVFEKEDQLGFHQTGHNSGVVHAGVYYPPHSLKAELCTRGRTLLVDFCARHDLPYRACGKLVVAVDEDELGPLADLETRSRANGVPGLRRVDEAGIAEVEPHAVGLAALHSPSTAITDYVAVARAMGTEVSRGGGRILTSTQVTGIRRRRGLIEVRTGTRVHRLDGLVLCAGLQSDRVADLVGNGDAAGTSSGGVDGRSRRRDGGSDQGFDGGPRIVPFRGEYLAVDPAKQERVSGMVYPVPDPRYPFLGVHFTRRVDGGLEVGPNAVLALAREGYDRTDVDLGDVADMARWPGSWRLARRHWRTGLYELQGSLSTEVFLQRAQRYVPSIGVDDVVRARSGVRAQAVDRDGSLVDDFRIDEGNGIVSVRNAPSPAATSSLAIAEYVVDRLPTWS